MIYLQWLSMAVNKLTDLEGLAGPALETLNLIGWSDDFCVRLAQTSQL